MAEAPFCASSPAAQLLTDDEFWAAVYPQPEHDYEPDMDDWPELVTTQCVKCQQGIKVKDYEEAIERQDESFCDDCADEMADELEETRS